MEKDELTAVCKAKITSPANKNRSAQNPAYIRIVKEIRRQISAGEYVVGSQLPSEAQLCASFDVSPMTVRRAINLLIDQGVVSTIQGKGTFIKPFDLNSSNFTLTPLVNLLGGAQQNEVQLKRVDLLQADDLTASRLSIGTQDRVIYITRLILKDKTPVILHREFLVYEPRSPIVESEMEVTKLLGLLEGRGRSTFKKGEFTIKSALLDKEDAQLLKTTAGSPIIRLEHTFYDYGDRKMSWGWFVVEAQHLEFTARVGIWD